MSKTIFVLLLGDQNGNPVDLYQDLMRKEAQAAGASAGFRVEVACAAAFEQYTVLRKRLADTSPAVDAVLMEPWSVSTMELAVKALHERAGLIILNAWDRLLEPYLKSWSPGLPVGVVSTPHRELGEIQAQQVSAAVPQGGNVLVVTGPVRSTAAPERFEGFRSKIRPDIQVQDTAGGQWNEADGILAFNDWYGIFKSHPKQVHAIAGQSDDLAVGARQASSALTNPDHAAMFANTKLFGIGGCPGYGKDRVDDGTLESTIILPAATVSAIELLKEFWTTGHAVPSRSFIKATAYPPVSGRA